MGASGDGEWGIALHCAELDQDDPRRLRLFAGCGIVAGSQPEEWWAQAVHDAAAAPEPHDDLKADADAERTSNEREQTAGRAGAGSSGVFSPGPAPADEQPSLAVGGGSASGDPLAGVTADADDVEDAVSGDTGPEHPGTRR